MPLIRDIGITRLHTMLPIQFGHIIVSQLQGKTTGAMKELYIQNDGAPGTRSPITGYKPTSSTPLPQIHANGAWICC